MEKQQLKILVTGASGMVGEGVLLECLQDEAISEVLVVGRKHCGIMHPKLKEILHADFFDLRPVQEELTGCDACFFCLGVSSVGMKEPEYTRLTYTLTLHMAEMLAAQNPGMTFIYVSGAGTDSSEKGRSMWARVKGKTENALQKLPFGHVYAFRPGFMKASPGQKNTLKAYKYLGWLYPVLKRIFPSGTSTLAQVGKAMIHLAKNPSDTKIWEVRDINSRTL